MPISRLSEIDLAKALAVPPGRALDAQMRTYNAGFGPWSYSPARFSLSDVVSARSQLLGATTPVAWTQIEGQIATACRRGQEQLKANLQVSRELYDAARAREWRAAQEPMGSLSIGFGESVRYWSDLVLEDENGPFIPFFDHRRSGGLANPEVQRMVFSLQNIGVRDRNPDLAGVRLAIVRFPVQAETRPVRVHFHERNELLSYDDLDERVRKVYATWARVSEERDAAVRKEASGGTNPFGF